MNAGIALFLPTVIARGDYYQLDSRGTPLQIEVVLHELDKPKRAYFLVLARTAVDTEVHLRTFYFTGKLTRRKLARARTLHKQSDFSFFKD